MITGKEFALQEAQKNKRYDTNSFVAGWYSREDFENGHFIKQETKNQLAEVRAKLEKIENYVRKLYTDFKISESHKYMGHEDPLGNVLCLKSHIYGYMYDFALKQTEEQFLLFPEVEV